MTTYRRLFYTDCMTDKHRHWTNNHNSTAMLTNFCAISSHQEDAYYDHDHDHDDDDDDDGGGGGGGENAA